MIYFCYQRKEKKLSFNTIRKITWYNDEEKGETMEKESSKITNITINGKEVYDNKNNLKTEELLKYCDNLGNSNILYLYAYSLLMKETNDKEISLKLTDTLIKLILWLEYGFNMKYTTNNLVKGIIKVYETKKDEINNLSVIELLGNINNN